MGTTVEQETAMREALVKERNEARVKGMAAKALKVGGKAYFKTGSSHIGLAKSNARD